MITLKHGDLFDVLPTLDADSLDACVTDPPYEIGFMGRAWDSSGVAFRPERLSELEAQLDRELLHGSGHGKPRGLLSMRSR